METFGKTPDNNERTIDVDKTTEDIEMTIQSEAKRVVSMLEHVRGILDEKEENLRRRVSGEISGVELDSIDAVLDKEIDATRDKIKSLNETINMLHVYKDNQEQIEPNYTIQQNEVSEDEPVEILDDVQNSVLDTMTVDTAEPINQEESQYRFPKVSEKEIFAENINTTNRRAILGAIAKYGDITAEDGYVYKAQDVISIISNLRGSNDPNLNRVTSTFDLREKVRRMLIAEENGIEDKTVISS